MSNEKTVTPDAYIIDVQMIHSKMSNHVTKHEVNVLTYDIKELMKEVTEIINDSKFINIDDMIIKCDNIDFIKYREL